MRPCWFRFPSPSPATIPRRSRRQLARSPRSTSRSSLVDRSWAVHRCDRRRARPVRRADSGDSLTFVSNNPEVASVSPTTGTIFAVAPGTAQIIATIDGRSGQRTITVNRPPAIRINEIKSNGDEPGGWVEFLNTTNVAVDMSGWTLTDQSVFHSELLPDGTTIPAHGYLVVDESTFPLGSVTIDGVHLFSRFGAQVDAYTWTSTPATTLGRCPDGFGDIVVTSASTRGATNTCATTKPK